MVEEAHSLRGKDVARLIGSALIGERRLLLGVPALPALESW